MQDIHMAAWEWLRDCPHVQDLFFAFARANAGDVVVLPLTAYSHTVQQEFIGAKEIRYNFALVHYELLSDAPNSTENIETLLNAEKLAAWVEAQDAIGHYPDVQDATVTAVGVLPSDAGHYTVQDDNTAKHMFQFYIDYLIKEETVNA